MKKGISIWAFGDLPLRESIALAAKAGYDGIELALNETGEMGLSTTEAELCALRAFAEEQGIAVSGLATGLYWSYSLTDERKEMREKAMEIARTQIHFAKLLGAEAVLIVPGAVRVSFAPDLGTVSYDTAYERALQALTELKKTAEAEQIQVGLENVWNKFLTSPLEMRDFIDKIDSPYVGAYFDVGNALQCGIPEQWIRILNKRIKRVHFKDYRENVGTLDGFVDLLAGDVDYPAVVQALREVGYDGYCTGEMIPPYTHHTRQIIWNTKASMDAILGA